MKFRIQKVERDLERYRVQVRIFGIWFNTDGTEICHDGLHSVYGSVEQAESAIKRFKEYRRKPDRPKWKTIK